MARYWGRATKKLQCRFHVVDEHNSKQVRLALDEPRRPPAPLSRAEVKNREKVVDISVPVASLEVPEDASLAFSRFKSAIFPFYSVCNVNFQALVEGYDFEHGNRFLSVWILFSVYEKKAMEKVLWGNTEAIRALVHFL